MLLAPGFSVLAHFFSHLVFLAVTLTRPFLSFISNLTLSNLLHYVDDIIVTGNNSSLIDSFTRKLHSEFAAKDFGSLSYVLFKCLLNPLHLNGSVSSLIYNHLQNTEIW